MSKDKLPTWFNDLKLDKELDAYTCKYKLGRKTIDIFLFTEDRRRKSRENLAVSADKLLSQWANQSDEILMEVRTALKKEKRLNGRNRSLVSRETVAPFSLSIFQNDGDDYYSYGLNVTGVLKNDEYIDYSRDVAQTWTTIDIASTED